MRLPILIFLLACTAHSVFAQRLFRDRRDAMGATAEVLVYAMDHDEAAPLFELAFGEIERVEQLLSDYRESSELSRINTAGAPVALDPEMARIMNRVLGWARQSGGAFDPTVGALVDAWGFHGGDGRVPEDSTLDAAMARTGWQDVGFDVATRTISLRKEGMRLDAGSFGKGYALDRAAQLLEEAGVTRALLSFGGSSYLALDAPPGQAGWLIHVDDPTDDGTLTTSVLLRHGALSTSGSSENNFVEGDQTYGHLLDPRSGQPADASVQVTVLVPNAMDADILSTATFVLGPEGAESLLFQVRGSQAWVLYDSPEGPAVRMINWQSNQTGQLP